MNKPNLFYALFTALAFCACRSASALPGADPELLSLVPPGAALVGGLTQGREVSYLVLTPNNQADLMDLQSITGVDPTRKIRRSIFVDASSGSGFLAEHSLLAIGHFDPAT